MFHSSDLFYRARTPIRYEKESFSSDVKISALAEQNLRIDRHSAEGEKSASELTPASRSHYI